MPYLVGNTIPTSAHIHVAPNCPFLLLEAVTRKGMKPGNKMKMGEKIKRKKVDGKKPKCGRKNQIHQEKPRKDFSHGSVL